MCLPVHESAAGAGKSGVHPWEGGAFSASEIHTENRAGLPDRESCAVYFELSGEGTGASAAGA